MNINRKRYRQLSLIEIGFNKKPKPDCSDMEKSSCNREPSLETEEKKRLSPSPHVSQDLLEFCQAVEDSEKMKKNDMKEKDSCHPDTSLETEEKRIYSPSPVESQDSLEICQAVEDSLHIQSGNNIDDFKICEEAASAEGSHKLSDDLFPTEPSEENDSIASSSNSQELFKSSNYEISESESESIASSDEIDHMSFLNRMPDCCIPLPKLEPLENHSIMFTPHIRPLDAPRPYPRVYTDKWDSDHVRMPCSPLNRCAVLNSYGEKVVANRWDIICRSLRTEIESSQELERAIMKYNSQYIGKWNFISLHTFINHHLSEEERDHFFETLLPAMIDMALDLPNICTQSIPLLKTGKDHYLTMSQKQIGCLLLNAFFCTFPRRTYPNNKKQMRYKWNSEYASYPEINFNRLFSGYRGDRQSRKIEKLKCLINYFKRIISNEPSGTVTFHRQSIPDSSFPNWQGSTRGIRSAIIRSSGLIESDGYGMLQVDFANKFVGGGILGQGCVQEEIRFAICPELIVSCLFTERFDRHEALIVTGVEQYNKYSGYADSFTWEGDFRDKVVRDSWGRKYTQLVAIDAISFNNSEAQFEIPCVKRELNKAYSGFYENGRPAHLPAVATGNWGCGVFKGNPNLKFIIQLMAASEAGRSLAYFTFGNKKLKSELQNLYDFLNNKNLTVGNCWKLLISYSNNVSARDMRKNSNLYDFFCSRFVTKSENCSHDEKIADQYLDDSDKKAINKIFEGTPFDGSTDEDKDDT